MEQLEEGRDLLPNEVVAAAQTQNFQAPKSGKIYGVIGRKLRQAHHGRLDLLLVPEEVVEEEEVEPVAVDRSQVRLDAAEVLLEVAVPHLVVGDGPTLLLVEEQPPDEEVKLIRVEDRPPLVAQHPGKLVAVLAEALERHLLLSGGQNLFVDFVPKFERQIVEVVLEKLPALLSPDAVDGGQLDDRLGHGGHERVLGQGHEAGEPLRSVSWVDRTNSERSARENCEQRKPILSLVTFCDMGSNGLTIVLETFKHILLILT